MRYSQAHKAHTYQRIVKEASVRFRRDGVAATGLQPLMKALGLTHGGFYAHFDSKQALVETVLREATAEMDTLISEAAAAPAPIDALIDRYLSESHRDHPEHGCPLPTLAAELGQRGDPSHIVDDALESRLAMIARYLPGDDVETRAVALWSALVGALVLARSVKDPILSSRILEDTRHVLKAGLHTSPSYPGNT
jgi:TetR/AcrR family transcriptional repressor of nem operon